jgi:hypothetical protein
VYKLCYHVPESHLESTKAALFEAGAGRVGNYDRCAWQVAGEGQFRPLDGSRPWRGEPQRLERLPEHRVEMVCEDDRVTAAVAALRRAHPYEEPSIAVWRVDSV